MSFESWAEDELAEIAMGLNQRRPSPHQSVFKYVSLNTKTSWEYLDRTLRKAEVVGSTAVALNDPFELSPFVFDDLRPSTVAAALKYNGLRDRLKGKSSEPEEVFAEVEPYRTEAEEYLARLTRNSRVVSFCARSDSPLLWSHYAHSYRGACLHFLAGGFRERRAGLGYVSYSEFRPTYPLSLALALAQKTTSPERSVRRAESDKLMFFTKAAEWAYENEIRSVYSTTSQACVSFDPDCLVSIVIGPRMPSEDEDRLRRAVAQSPLAHLKIRRARLSNTSFSVEVD